MTTPSRPPITLRHLPLALAPALYMLVNATGVWEHLFGPGRTHLWIENEGLLWLCAALCALGYARHRQLPAWSFPSLGLALVMLALGAGSVPLLFPWGVALVVVAFAAAFGRPIAGRSWEMWLVDLVVTGALFWPLVMPDYTGPPVAPATALAAAITAALWLPQAVFSVAGLFCVLSIIFAWRLAPRAGLLAGLVPAANLLWVWNGIGDPAYTLGMWTENRALVGFMELLASLTLVALVVAVLLARRPAARLAAFLLPLSAGLLMEVVVDLTVRPRTTLSGSLSDALMFAAPLVIALWLCARRVAPAPSLPAAGA